MGKVYYDKDGDINVVRDKVVAIIGYGSHSQLIKSCAVYQEIAESQMGITAEVEADG